MNKGIIFALGLGALALAMLIATSPPVRAASSPSPVFVTNTPLSPLPVTGTVAAAQSGSWTVDVAGPVNVHPSNKAVHVRFGGPSTSIASDFTNTTQELVIIDVLDCVRPTISQAYFQIFFSLNPSFVDSVLHFKADDGGGFQFFHHTTAINLAPGDTLATGGQEDSCSGFGHLEAFNGRFTSP